MLDPRILRHDIDNTAQRLRIRQFELDVAGVSSLEAQRRELQVETESLQAERNSRSKEIGKARDTECIGAKLKLDPYGFVPVRVFNALRNVIEDDIGSGAVGKSLDRLARQDLIGVLRALD